MNEFNEFKKFKEFKEEIKGATVSVFGLGVSGMAAFELLHLLGAKLKVIDQGAPTSWKNFSRIEGKIGADSCLSQTQAEAPEVLATSDLIILSPGISLDHPVLKEARDKNVPIWSEIELGYQFADVPVICVTGTNGKTTTVSLMADMFERSHRSVFVGGNIGTPFCQLALEKLQGRGHYEYIVLEISSFQLETIHSFHPHIVVITNIFANHEERYPDMESYAKAKFRVALNMTEEDYLIYPQDQRLIHDWACNQVMKKVAHQKEMVLDELSSQFDLSPFSLSGWHNWENLFCAKKALELLGIGMGAVQETIRKFRGVPHRLEKVTALRPYKVVNDAKSTNLAATETALKSLEPEREGREIYLIFGGKKRDENDQSEYRKIPWQETFAGVSKVFLIGETTDELSGIMGTNVVHQKSYTLESAVAQVDKESFTGILLFSPGHPSFDQFQNYAHRGEVFKSLFAPLK